MQENNISPTSNEEGCLFLDRYYMSYAIQQALNAYALNEVPVGAVIVKEGKIITQSFNRVEKLKSSTAHAEIIAINYAEQSLGCTRLNDCDIYITKEPCFMCAGALIHARFKRVIFGCSDFKSGAAGGKINILQMQGINHQCEVTSGILADEAAALLEHFFIEKRKLNKLSD